MGTTADTPAVLSLDLIRTLAKALMEDKGHPAKRTAKKPRVTQVMTDQGFLVGVLYDNGRVFLWNYTTFPNKALQDPGGGYWSTLTYPELVAAWLDEVAIQARQMAALARTSCRMRSTTLAEKSLWWVDRIFLYCNDGLALGNENVLAGMEEIFRVLDPDGIR